MKVSKAREREEEEEEGGNTHQVFSSISNENIQNGEFTLYK